MTVFAASVTERDRVLAVSVTERDRVLAVSVTERGRALAEQLPYEHVHGALAATVRERWADVEGFVLLVAVGAAVRIVAPLLGNKGTDPAVVCVDDAGRHVVALLGGHAADANLLATEVAGLLGAEPVITTATDVTGIPGLDQLPGLTAVGDLPGVTAALLDGAPVVLERRLDWTVPETLVARTVAAPGVAAGTAGAGGAGEGGPIGVGGPAGVRGPAGAGGPARAAAARIVLTDQRIDLQPGVVALHPPSLVAGVGSSSGAPLEEVASLLAGCLEDAGLAPQSLCAVATIDRRASEPAIIGLGLPVATFSAADLATVSVPSPSAVVAAAVGTPSVAEAAALLAAGPDAVLLVQKSASSHATVSIARRGGPAGRIVVVGLGPGGASGRTTDAVTAVRGVEVVVGYQGYVDQCADLIRPHQVVLASPIGSEVERATTAARLASEGRSVAVVCSGDPGVYAMASLVLETSTGIEVQVVPGVTAALAAAARLGAPLGHDHLILSLSDLLTPWEAILRRVEAARDADLVLALYNPRSKQRDWQLGAVRDLLLARRPPETPVGVVTDAGRPGEVVTIATLATLDPELVGMTTCVIIGSSTTRMIGGRMVTPRGYRSSSS